MGHADLLAAVAGVVRAAHGPGGRGSLAVAARAIADRAGARVVALQLPGGPIVRFPPRAVWPPAALLRRWHARVVQRRRAVRVRRPGRTAARDGVVLPVFLPTGDVGALAVFFAGTRRLPTAGEMAELLLLAGTAGAAVAGRRLRQHTEAVTAAEVHGRIARELHDGPLQILTAVLLRLRLRARAGAGGAEVYRGVETELQRAIHQMRALIGHVRASRPLQPLSGRIRNVLARLAETGQLSWSLRWRGGARLRGEVADELVAVVQEALVNASRHAAATRVEVTGRRQGAVFEVVVRDNGVGFDPAAARRGRRGVRTFGLRYMRERVAGLGGTLAIRSRPGRGTRVVIRVPLGRARREGGTERRRGE
jgi:signal transduction histidine kinase